MLAAGGLVCFLYLTNGDLSTFKYPLTYIFALVLETVIKNTQNEKLSFNLTSLPEIITQLHSASAVMLYLALIGAN